MTDASHPSTEAEPVAHQPFAATTFLMCPPTHYTTSFFLNPWLRYWEDVDPTLAREQWAQLKRTIESCGASVRLIEPLPESPAMVFTADTAIVYAPKTAMVLRNDGPRSQVEATAVQRWLADDDFLTEVLPPAYTIDGGNVLRLTPDQYLIGLKPGSPGKSERYVSRMLERFAASRMRPIALHDRRFLHLDTVVGNLGGRALLAFWEGMLPISRDYLADEVALPTIAVTEADAEHFACNCITIGSHVITGLVSDDLASQIEAVGFEVHRLDMSEFYKAGGGAKCLTLPLAYDSDQD
jgi:N-dimethylarginine dimethylaminohydrolase